MLTPYPLERMFEGQPRLKIGARMTTNMGWLDLNDGPYRLEASAFAERTVSWRKREVQSDYVEGTFIVNAVRENVTETLNVWVRGETHYELAMARERLEDALCQLTYRISFRTSDVTRYWECSVADYTVATQREFQHACIALVRATVPRHPEEQLVMTSVDEL
jgi:hypothetical protein